MKTVTHSYDNDAALHKDTARLAKKGFTPVATTTTPGHLGTRNKGLNVAVGLLTGGLGLFMARTPARTTVTYQCDACR